MGIALGKRRKSPSTAPIGPPKPGSVWLFETLLATGRKHLSLFPTSSGAAYAIDAWRRKVAAITGHQTANMARKYSRQKRTAEPAVLRLDAALASNGKRVNTALSGVLTPCRDFC